MARFVMGLIIGGVLVMGIASGQGRGGPGEPQTTPAPGSWVDVPLEAPTGTILAVRGHCRRGYEVRQVRDEWDTQPWRSVHYRCRPSR